MMDVVSVLALLATLVGVYYAKKAADSTKEMSFPPKNPRQSYKIIKHYSKEAHDFEDFIARNVDRKVYLNVYFDGHDFLDFVTLPTTDESGSIIINTLSDNASEKERILRGSDHFIIHIINSDSDAILGWNMGDYRLKGYFCIIGYGGPKQGGMGATLRPVNINS